MRYLVLLTVVVVFALPTAPQAQKQPDAITSSQRTMALNMLQTVRDAVQHDYYDPNFHGYNLKAGYEKSRADIQKAPTLGAAFRMIAAFLSGLHDSHTFFIPPSRSWDFYYGYRMAMVGDRAFITSVRPGSDAATKLHPGDEIVRLEGYSVNRQDFWPLSYDLNALEPRGGLRFQLRAPDGATRDALVRTRFVQHGGIVEGLDSLYIYAVNQEDLDAAVYKLRDEAEGNVFVAQVPNFTFDPSEFQGLMHRAQKYPNLVLDLRGNPGGAVDDLKEALGYFVTDKITIATRKGRKHQGREEVGPNHAHYPGKLFVVVDSGSASAAELFARTVQLDHLGTVIGDKTAGAVMEAQEVPMQYGMLEGGAAVLYGASITSDDLIMPDGNSLENIGVTPDVVALPSAADMAAGRDTVLARAVQLAGGTADPAELAKTFAVIWPPK